MEAVSIGGSLKETIRLLLGTFFIIFMVWRITKVFDVLFNNTRRWSVRVSQRPDPALRPSKEAHLSQAAPQPVLSDYIARQNDILRRKQASADEKKAAHEAWLANREKYIALYQGKSIKELSGAPFFCYVGKDFLPACALGEGKWGVAYTFVYTRSTHRYHRLDCRYAKMSPGVLAGPCVNAYNIYRCLDHSCRICKPTLPDMEWYENYKRIKKVVERFEIDLPPDEDPFTVSVFHAQEQK